LQKRIFVKEQDLQIVDFWISDPKGFCFIAKNFIPVECSSANCKKRIIL